MSDITRSMLARNQRAAVGIRDFHAVAMREYAPRAGDQAEGDTSDTSAAQSVVGGVTNGNAHNHYGGDGARIDHAHLINVTANQHHSQVHALVSSDHTATGLTTGHVVRASGSAAFAWAQLQHSDLGEKGTNTHAQIDGHIAASSGVHGISGSVVGTIDAQVLGNKVIDGLKIYDTDKSHTALIVWNEGDTVDRVFNLKLHAGNRTLDLNQSLTIGSGYDGTLAFSAASKVLTVDETQTISNYHTDTRADTWLATKTTGDLAEGTNLYFTDARADARIAVHAADASAHHAKYTDAEAVAAIKADAAWNATDWDTAYGWGDHSLGGYLTFESDPVFSASAAAGIASGDITNWNTAYGWGDHSLGGYLTDIVGESIGDLSDVTITGPADLDILQYDLATGKWVDRSLAEAGIAATGHTHDDRYYTETEVDTALAGKSDTGHSHGAGDITSGTFADARIAKTNITQFNYTYSELGLPIDDIPADGVITEPISSNWAYDHLNNASAHHAKYTDAEAVAAIKADAAWNATDWDTAYGWGDHASAGYAPTASPTFTGTVTIPKTADDATYTGIVTNDNGILKYRTKAQILSDIGAAASSHTHDGRYYTETEINTWRNSTTQTEMGYVHGVTSDIQTQLNGKASSSHNHAASDITSGTFANARIAKGNITQFSYSYADLSLPIDNTPANGVTTEPISSNWAYDHAASASAHHSRYTDSEARSAMSGQQVSFDTIMLNNNESGDADIDQNGEVMYDQSSGLWLQNTYASAPGGSGVRKIFDAKNLIAGDNIAISNANSDTQSTISVSPQGSGSGLDADTVDGSHASAFAASSHTHDGRYYTETEINTWRNSVTQTEMGYLHGVTSDIQTQLNGKAASSHTHSQYIRSDTNDNVSGHTEWQDYKEVRLGNGADFRIYHTGVNTYLDNHTGPLYIRVNGTETAFAAVPNDNVVLYYNGNTRIWTQSYGASIEGRLEVGSHLKIGTVDAAGTDPDKFLVLDGNNYVDYRTGSQVLSDIGGASSNVGVLFSAYIGGQLDNVTGDDTVYTLTGTMWTEVDDLGNDFSNGTFTAPKGGYYLFTGVLQFRGITTNHTLTRVDLKTSNRTYSVYLNAIHPTSDYEGLSFSFLADLDQSDVAYLRATVYGSSKVVDILVTTYFQGVFISDV